MKVLALSALGALSDAAVAQAHQLHMTLSALCELLASAQEKHLPADLRQADLLAELRKLAPEIQKWVEPK